MKSPRNKTITLQENEIKLFQSKLLSPKSTYTLSELQDKIIHGDTIQVLPSLPKKSVDLLIIDPPYNLSKKYNQSTFHQRSEDSYIAYLEEWIPLLIPILKANASIYVCCDWKSSPAIYQVLSKYFLIQNRITWQREKGRGAKSNWKNGMEDIWFATCSKDYYFNVEAVKIKKRVIAPYKENGTPKDWEETKDGKFRLTYPSNFWDDISIPYWSMPENTEHPTQKPEKLLAKLILASSKEGDVVFDPFAGSGSTLVTAKKLNRQFFGIERELEYCCLGLKRLQIAEENKIIQGYDGVFWERNSGAIPRS